MSPNVVAIRAKEPAHRPWQKVNHTEEQIKKVIRQLEDDFIEECNQLDAPALKTYLSDLANHEETILVAKANDVDLIDLREQAKVIVSGYASQLRGIRARRAYVCHLIDQLIG